MKMRVQGKKVLARRNSRRSGGMLCCEAGMARTDRREVDGPGSHRTWGRARLEIQPPQEDSEKRDVICLQSEQAHLGCSVETRLLPQGPSGERREVRQLHCLGKRRRGWL